MEEEQMAASIRKRIEMPGWTTTRAILGDPAHQLPREEHKRVEDVMRKMAADGEVRLWKLIIEDQNAELMAAAQPDMELDKELDRREAWARAEEIKD